MTCFHDSGIKKDGSSNFLNHGLGAITSSFSTPVFAAHHENEELAITMTFDKLININDSAGSDPLGGVTQLLFSGTRPSSNFCESAMSSEKIQKLLLLI